MRRYEVARANTGIHANVRCYGREDEHAQRSRGGHEVLLRRLGVQAAFDGKRILLTKPEEGVYAEGMMIVVGEQGEIDVSGRSLGPVYVKDRDTRKKELIAEIISHFSL